MSAALPVIRDEPSGDPLQRLGLQLALVSLVAGLVPLLGLAWAGVPRAVDPLAHARIMAFGFVGLFILSYLLRIVPRSRRVSLPRPSWGRAGLWLGAAAACVDGAGAPLQVVAGLWGASSVGLAGSLGAAWFSERRTAIWFEGFVGSGLVGCAIAAAALVFGLFSGMAVAWRAPVALVGGGLLPIALGVSLRMLPALAGVGPVDREKAAAAGKRLAPVAPVVAIALLIDDPVGEAFAAAGIAWLVLRSAALLRWTQQRNDGGAQQAERRQDDDVVALRWHSRVAYAAAIAGALALLVWVLDGAPRSLGVHLLGLGFLAGLALSVGQRIMPSFHRADVRWPKARHGVGVLYCVALGLRIAAFWLPSLLVPAAVLLLACVGLFFAQIRSSLKTPGLSGRRPPNARPHAPTPSPTPGPASP